MCFERTEKDMASLSRAFWKLKNAEEERKLLETAIYTEVTTGSDKMVIENFLGMADCIGRKNKSPVI